LSFTNLWWISYEISLTELARPYVQVKFSLLDPCRQNFN